MFICGLTFGSFLALVCERLPSSLSLIHPHSRCDSCGQRLKMFDLVPLISYFCLKGRCRYCHSKIGFDKPFIELLSGMSFYLVSWYYHDTLEILLILLLHTLLLLISVIDFKHYLIPLRFQFCFVILSVLLSFQKELHFTSRLLGVCSVSSILLCISLLSQSLGGGDVILIAIAGYLLGFPHIVIVISIASFCALLYGLFIDISIKIPFAPFICFGIVIVYHFGELLLSLYTKTLLFNENTLIFSCIIIEMKGRGL